MHTRTYSNKNEPGDIGGMPKTYILAIDGGGMKGIISAMILNSLEQKLQKYSKNPNARIAEYFDMIAGTSTGAILAALYLMPDENGNPKYTAQDALNLYLEKGRKIFHQTVWRSVLTLNGIRSPKYSNKALETILAQYVGEQDIASLTKPCLIISYDIVNASAFFFDSGSAQRDRKRNYRLRDAVLASTAAPTYFPAV